MSCATTMKATYVLRDTQCALITVSTSHFGIMLGYNPPCEVVVGGRQSRRVDRER